VVGRRNRARARAAASLRQRKRNTLPRRIRPIWSLCAVLLAFTLVSAACGGNNKSGGSSSSTNTTHEAEADSATPKTGGTLTYGLEAESTGGFCIPEAQLAAGGISVHNAIYDPLMAFDANLDPKPYLAESVTPNAQYTQYTVKVRSGIKFHDGEALNADAVKLAFDTARGDKAALAETGRQPLLAPIVLSNIASINKVDDLTLTFDMKVPWPAFPTYLASGRFGIAAPAQLKAPDCSDKLIGTGPFKLVSWTRNQQMVLERNPDYWRKDPKGRQLPYLDKLIFKPIPSSSDRVQALEGGSIDAGQWEDQSSFDQIQKESSKFSLTKDTAGHREISYGLLNVQKAPLNDPEIRKYMQMAIDRNALNDIDTNGQWTLANQLYDSKVMGYQADLKGPKYDPEAAQKFFKGKNLSINLSYATDPVTKALAEDVQRQLKDVGVTVNVDEKDQSTLINQALTGDFNVLLWRNNPGVDPDANYVWWQSTEPTNFGRMQDPEIDAALNDGRSNPDQNARKADYEKIGTIMAEKYYVLPEWYSQWGIGSTNKVHQIGYYTLPDGSNGAGLNWGWSYWTNVWVDH
jgi:peptide/nickel transport system substrate-binding protein